MKCGASPFHQGGCSPRVEEARVRCEAVDLAAAEFDSLPADFVRAQLAVAKVATGIRSRSNAGSVGLLMAHCRRAKAYLHCHRPQLRPAGRRTPHPALRSGRQLQGIVSDLPISKIAGEVVARTMARALGVPTVIARLNVPYATTGDGRSITWR